MSGEVVRIVEVQREKIMAKLIEVHENIQHLWGREESQAIAQQQEKVQRPPAQKEGEEIVQLVV
jgi:hypothetical protein